MLGIMKMTLKERFDAKWRAEGEDWIIDGVNVGKCWIWQGSLRGGRKNHRYGGIRYQKKDHQATRVGYELYIGVIPEKYELDHIVCKNTACVNPKHLRPVDIQTNRTENSDGPSAHNKRKTHCIRGHEFSEENTRIGFKKNGKSMRNCKACTKIYNNRFDKDLSWAEFFATEFLAKKI
jgi:hypothetical protein